MKVLVCVPHFYNRSRSYDSAVLGSSVETLQERIETVRYCLRRLQALLADNKYNLTTSPASSVGFDTVEAIPNTVTGDICLCCSREDQFLNELTSGALLKAIHNDGDPRLLGYACRRVFARNIDRYDLYCFIEDDHAILDPEFFEKVAYFYKRFGEDKLILPSRFELAGLREVAWKTYIDDGAFARMRVEPPASAEPTLTLGDWKGLIEFDLDLSPFCGCYIITNAQLRAWMQMSDFQEPDPEWLTRTGILEVAMLPMLARLPIYKPAKRNASFLEIHHVPNRLCNGRVPQNAMKAAVQQEIDRRIAGSFVVPT
jgi:hypothetical protein